MMPDQGRVVSPRGEGKRELSWPGTCLAVFFLFFLIPALLGVAGAITRMSYLFVIELFSS